MRILIASSEAVPFSKTGGLADVASALPKALERAGYEVWLVTPHYPRVLAKARHPVALADTGTRLDVPIGSRRIGGSVLHAKLPGSNVSTFLIDQPHYFDREGLYVENGRDYKDNCERFVFFSRAVLEMARHHCLRPDVIHANDWQTGLIPALLDVEYRKQPDFERTGSVFTIHNMAFQGQFWHWDMLLTGLDWKYFNWQQMEFFSHLNLLKTGISFADMITTVSPTYAREIQTPQFGCNLDRALVARRNDLIGILNGVDKDEWNPATDPHIARNYDVNTVAEGKAACKAQLQEIAKLPQRPDAILFGMITRLTDQKGVHLLLEAAETMLQQDIQICILGSGDHYYEQKLKELAARYPDKLSATIGFDEVYAHRIEAGSDVYLMPSAFEPCGLNQMYSLRYGTLPLVHAVGGLADTVADASSANLASGRATGFSFQGFGAYDLIEQVARVVGMYRYRDLWMQMVRTAMNKDVSWEHSAAEYGGVYRRAVERHATSKEA